MLKYFEQRNFARGTAYRARILVRKDNFGAKTSLNLTSVNRETVRG